MSIDILKNYILIKDNIKTLSLRTNLIVVCKNRDISEIKNIITSGHLHFGENKVQEAVNKWSDILNNNKNINLHFIGRLQSNKAEEAFNIFNFVHSLDNEKLALIFSNLEKFKNKKIKYFVQVNIGNEKQKGGIQISYVHDFINYCKNDLNLNIIGLMCIPPLNCDPNPFFMNLNKLNIDCNLQELSMGMSSDYIEAIKNGSTFVRIGSAIFNN